MTFQERLAEKKKKVEGNLSPSYVKIMHRATQELQRSGLERKVLKAGDALPPFELPDQNGSIKSSSEALKKGPLVITFYRGFWCPYCNIDLANLNQYVPRFNEQGATMFTISPEKSEYSRKIIAMQRLSFDILWDEGNQLAEQFNLKFSLPEDLKALYRDKFSINLKMYHGDDEWALPMPARFLIDQDGMIRYAESSADYTRRPDPDDLLKVLENLT